MIEHPTRLAVPSTVFRLGGAIALVAILGASARAAPPAAAPASAPSGADEARLAAALDALNAGVDRFEADDVAGALWQFEAARDLAPHKARPYLWLGRAWVRLQRCDRALPALQQFLIRVGPDHADRAEAEATARRCQSTAPGSGAAAPASVPKAQRTAVPSPPGGGRAAVESGPVEPAPPGPVPPEAVVAAPRSPRPQAMERAPWPRLALRRAGIGLVVAGAALAVAGGVGFGLLARDHARAILQAADRSSPFDRRLEDAGRLDQALSIASIAVGGAAAVAGTVALALSWRVEGAARPLQPVALVPAAGPGFLGVAAHGAF